MFNLNSIIVQNKIKSGEITQDMLNRFGTYYGSPAEYTRGSDGLTDQERGYIVGHDDMIGPDEKLPIAESLMAKLKDVEEIRAENPQPISQPVNPTPVPQSQYIPQQPMYQYTSMPVQGMQQPQMFQPAGNMPFMSPREMVVNGYTNQTYQQQPQPYYQNQYYQQPYQPRNIVGGYNPGYQQAFGGYSNPYMGQGSYMGFGSPYQESMYIDDTTRNILYKMSITHKTYMEQLEDESNLYKKMCRIANKVMGKSEEEIERRVHAYDIYDKAPKREIANSRNKVKLHVAVVNEKGEILEDYPPEYVRPINHELNANIVKEMEMKSPIYKERKIQMYNYMYDHAVERQMDNVVDLVDFFNNHAWKLMADTSHNELLRQQRTNSTKMYDHKSFRERLLKNNGIMTRSTQNATERYVGRYGVMPDGRPVSEYNDPAIAESFAYNERTGTIEITVPDYLQRNIDRAKMAFRTTLG